MSALVVRIENWSLVDRVCGDNPSLSGNVFGHPRFSNGERVVSTPISDVTSDRRVTTRSGSVYALGSVDASYEREYPNAFERLVLTATRAIGGVQ